MHTARPHLFLRNSGCSMSFHGPVGRLPLRRLRLRRVSRRASLRPQGVGVRQAGPAQDSPLTSGPGLRYPRGQLVNGCATWPGRRRRPRRGRPREPGGSGAPPRKASWFHLTPPPATKKRTASVWPTCTYTGRAMPTRRAKSHETKPDSPEQ